MEEASEEQLGAMGLSIRPPNLDANPEFDDWTKKTEYHDKIKGNTSQPMMPTSLVMWRKENGTKTYRPIPKRTRTGRNEDRIENRCKTLPIP